MAAPTVPTSLILLGAALLYILFYYPIGYIILTVAIAVITFLMNRDYTTPLGVLVVMIIIRTLGDLLTPKPKMATPYTEDFQAPAKPVAKEGFQAKDPISIHQRITKQRVPQAPVDSVTGVLESPDILDNFKVGKVSAIEEGFTNSVQPANLAANVAPMATPAESSMPRGNSPDAAPMSNPALITGPDPVGVEMAMANKGTALNAAPAANMSATTNGPAPYE